MAISGDRYPGRQVEEKWQKFWKDMGLFTARENTDRPKFYILEMYPYPSGDLHVGHMENYIYGDVIARYYLMKGYEVLHPFGWDAFGLPAENSAIKMGIKPSEWTFNNISESKRSLGLLGFSYDWERELTTCLPDYYKWTQWIFLKLYEHDLAYRKESFVNWCPGCQTVLANEQVTSEGLCYRCDSQIQKKTLIQWFFRITAYANRLLDDLDKLKGWIPEVVTMQRNWIGKSEGTEIIFELESGEKLPVFTTRADTLFGVTFITIAPEHPIIKELITKMPTREETERYIEESMRKTEIERTSTIREKDGVFTGLYAIHPLTNERIPIWVGDYVLASYGTGIVMGVPAHDQRDFEFARKYNIPIRIVVEPVGGKLPEVDEMESAFEELGVMVNSGEFSGLNSLKGMEAVTKKLDEIGRGGAMVNYKLRDWLISRQRYWGCPIPIIHCEKCGIVPVPYEDLPVLLPPEEEVDFIPRGRSVLATSENYMNTICPRCGGYAMRDPDTMDTYVCSSWYFLRYADAKNNEKLFDREKANYWLPVDQYIGGKEHATSHLLYSRFFTKFFKDLGLIDFDEPFTNYFSQGMVMRKTVAEDGAKKLEVMSKSKGNAIPVGPFVNEYGADCARVVMLFAGPPEQDKEWSDEGVVGANRFLNRLWRLITTNKENIAVHNNLKINNLENLDDNAKRLYRRLHLTVKKATEDIENIHYNTAIASFMELLNELQGYENKGDEVFSKAAFGFIWTIAPFTPHIAEELFHQVGGEGTIFRFGWPEYDMASFVKETVDYVIQINGKVRGHITVKAGLEEEQLREIALKDKKINNKLSGKEIERIIIVKNKLINIVAK
ncbi:MAG: leucine--tRNA ligase [Candidatus Coatesbacteria bacterium]|nr:MAG: leucine--tRNA ligase [Candidatus Coatesbacteria bacterium]RLC44703.1 MAG: leucine--tRNA ligase [Candidatus Coatesbacteria bacterium]